MISAVSLTLIATSPPPRPGELMASATLTEADVTTRHWTVDLNKPANDAIGMLSVVVTISSRCGSGFVSVRPDDPRFGDSTVRLLGGLDGTLCDAFDVDASTTPADDSGADDSGADSDSGDDDAGGEGGRPTPMRPSERSISTTVDLGLCQSRGACSRGFTLITLSNDPASPVTVTVDVRAIARSEHGGCGCLGSTSGIPFPIDASVTLVPDA
jgi:hypothetical protein